MVEPREYIELNRRLDCDEHCPYADQAKKCVPRVYFFASWSALLIVALAFGGWHVSSLDKLRIELASNELTHKAQVDLHVANGQLAYQQGVERFIRAIGDNRVAIGKLQSSINDAKVEQAKIITLQNLVLSKVGLAVPVDGTQ